MTDGIPGSSVKVTLVVVEKRKRMKVTLVAEETLVTLVALVEERRRSRRDCISLGNRELDPHRGVLPISYHIKGMALNVH